MTEGTKNQLVKRYGELPEFPLRVLGTIYRKSCKEKHIITKGEIDAIGEYYRVIENRGLPAYYWLCEVFSVISKKEHTKQNMRYAIGIIRSWLKFGFGHIPSQEEREVLEYFEELIGMEASPELVQKIQSSMGQFGVVKLTRALGRIENDLGSFIIDGIISNLDKEVVG